MTQTGTSNFIEDMDDETFAYKLFESEGFDYFFDGYISVESIKDPLLRKYVKEYLEARNVIIGYLADNGIESDY